MVAMESAQSTVWLPACWRTFGACCGLAAELMRQANMLGHVVLLQLKFMEQSQALLHGDLHTGSILVTPESTQA